MLQSVPQVKALDEAGREVFDEVGPELLANGLLTRASLKLFTIGGSGHPHVTGCPNACLT